ncbi:MAG: nitrile hydratase subunit alpha [Phycisphaerales bacterium]|nr:nitrile hydratase subunit alpha [Phycisphaerales bacterium]
MSNAQEKLVDLYAACWDDPDLKSRFMKDPNAVLEEYGIDASNLSVNVLENTNQSVNIILPPPPSNMDSLSEEELLQATMSYLPKIGVKD